MTGKSCLGGGARGKIVFVGHLNSIAASENLFEAWEEFLLGKKKKPDIQEFSLFLSDNIIKLSEDLFNHTYQHGPYQAFRINDPKPRQIHKSSVRDRLLHHGVYRILYPFFDRTFIADSFSCRLNKGTHKAMARFRKFGRQVSCNNTCTCWVLKCDIRKFFENIDHNILLGVLKRYIPDVDIIALIENIIKSFSAAPGRGLPLGNLTSQLLVNIYMNEFDQWMKHHMKAKHYIRYADDFVIFSDDKDWLLELTPKISAFLEERLKLQLHPDKVFIKTLASGVDFLGWVHFADHRVIRQATKRRMFRNLEAKPDDEAVKQSYLGLLSHGNAKKLQNKISEAIRSG